jgi:hypothetical protein
MNFSFLAAFFLLLSFQLLHAQSGVQRNELVTQRLGSSPQIDGLGDDEAWQQIDWNYEGKFTQFVPDNLEPSANTTRFKIGYTDMGLYVFAQLDDPNPPSIARELGLRDDFGRAADRFAVIIDTYNQGQNAAYFGVTAAGVQLDLFNSSGNEDVGWDAVYTTAVEFTEQGWQVEMEIPWSMLRFSRQEQDKWGFNIIRELRSDGRELAAWNPINAEIDGFITQLGYLRGIQDIDPPLRLQLFPYVSAVAGRDGISGENNTNFGGGMDIKWGISESFTLDMTLVPDFSQVQADNQILNLSPFEVRYEENRPFFTEGTELFNRGNIFYSRRVGGVRREFESDLPDSVEIVSRPSAAKLMNAFKITGRTPKGLGVGVFNAITEQVVSDARIVRERIPTEQNPDTLEYIPTTYITDPRANFSMVVVDKNLPNNSNVALWNTNVTRFEGGQDGNVVGTDFRLRDKTNTYQLSGFGAYSTQFYASSLTDWDKQKDGYRYRIGFDKISGNWQFGGSRVVESENYDINDLGILFFPNEISHNIYSTYQIFKPFWIFNNLGSWMGGGYSQLKEPRKFGSVNFGNELWGQFKNFWNFSLNMNFNPTSAYDFTEPRVWGYQFERLRHHSKSLWVGTNPQKRFYTGFNIWNFERKDWNASDWGMSLSPRYRVSNKLSVSTRIQYTRVTNERGYATQLRTEEGELRHIIFGDRDSKLVVPELFVEYTVNDKMGLNGRLRLYRNRVAYDDLYDLTMDGETVKLSQAFLDREELVPSDYNRDFTTLNVELLYRWQVAPGSFFTASYQGYSDNFFEDGRYQGRVTDFRDNRFARLQPLKQTVSLRLTYFIDYLMMKNLVSKTPDKPERAG